MTTNSVFLHSLEIATVCQEVASKVLILKMENTKTRQFQDSRESITIVNFKTLRS